MEKLILDSKLSKPFPHFWENIFGSCHAPVTLTECGGIRQTGVSTAESKSSTSKAIAGPSFEGFQSSDDILLIAKVDGPRSYSIQ